MEKDDPKNNLYQQLVSLKLKVHWSTFFNTRLLLLSTRAFYGNSCPRYNGFFSLSAQQQGESSISCHNVWSNSNLIPKSSFSTKHLNSKSRRQWGSKRLKMHIKKTHERENNETMLPKWEGVAWTDALCPSTWNSAPWHTHRRHWHLGTQGFKEKYLTTTYFKTSKTGNDKQNTMCNFLSRQVSFNLDLSLVGHMPSQQVEINKV